MRMRSSPTRTPSLDEPHTAISQHFKRFDADPAWVWDMRDDTWHDYALIDSRVLVYKDRVQGWFFQWGELLTNHHNAGFAVLMIAVGYLEGNQQYRNGQSSAGQSRQFVVQALRRLVPALSDDDANAFYSGVRCGLFHDGITKAGVFINHFLDAPVARTERGLEVNPAALLQAAKADFAAYIDLVLSATEVSLRSSFERRWPGTR